MHPFAPVAQLDRVPDYESGGRTFESYRARHIQKEPHPTDGAFLYPVGPVEATYPFVRSVSAESNDEPKGLKRRRQRRFKSSYRARPILKGYTKSLIQRMGLFRIKFAQANWVVQLNAQANWVVHVYLESCIKSAASG